MKVSFIHENKKKNLAYCTLKGVMDSKFILNILDLKTSDKTFLKTLFCIKFGRKKMYQEAVRRKAICPAIGCCPSSAWLATVIYCRLLRAATLRS